MTTEHLSLCLFRCATKTQLFLKATYNFQLNVIQVIQNGPMSKNCKKKGPQVPISGGLNITTFTRVKTYTRCPMTIMAHWSLHYPKSHLEKLISHCWWGYIVSLSDACRMCLHIVLHVQIQTTPWLSHECGIYILNSQSVKVEEASSCLSVRFQNDTSKQQGRFTFNCNPHDSCYPDGYTKSDELHSSPKTNFSVQGCKSLVTSLLVGHQFI